MATCGSKFVSGSSRKATVAESVFVGYRPRSRGRMPSLVGDSGHAGAWGAGWALLTGMHNLPFVLQCHRKGISTVAVCGTEL